MSEEGFDQRREVSDHVRAELRSVIDRLAHLEIMASSLDGGDPGVHHKRRDVLAAELDRSAEHTRRLAATVRDWL